MATVVIWNVTLVRAMTVELSFKTERPKCLSDAVPQILLGDINIQNSYSKLRRHNDLRKPKSKDLVRLGWKSDKQE